jgi:hypothetical protein
MKQLTTPLTGATMAKYSKNYRTGDASRFPSTPMTYSPPNDALQLLTTEWMGTMLCLQSAVGGHLVTLDVMLAQQHVQYSSKNSRECTHLTS